MKSGPDDDLAAQFAAIVPGASKVEITGSASLGAQRRTFFIDITADGRKTRAVAQIATPTIGSPDVAAEARLLRAAAEAGVAVPRLLAFDANLGAVISEHVDGETIPRRILRRVASEAGLAARLTADCGSALAAIHAIPAEAFDGYDDFTRADHYIARMEQLLAALSAPQPSFRLGINWLRRHATDAVARTAVVHGDFRLGNLLVDQRGLAAVLDWELAHLGDPMEDLAWLCLRTWRFGNDAETVGGFGSQSELRDAYEAAGGSWRDAAFEWWTVARSLWWGIGLAFQAQAFIDRQTTSIVLAASGRRVVELEYDLLKLIET